MTNNTNMGRPAYPKEYKTRQLKIRCTDAEWQALLESLPRGTRDRYEAIVRSQKKNMPVYIKPGD